MNKFPVLLAFLVALLSPAMAIRCYEGILDDGDKNPEEDFTEDMTEECMTDFADPDGDDGDAVCVKVRLSYGDSFLSYYYCENDWRDPTSTMATYFNYLPDPGNDECNEEDDLDEKDYNPDDIVLEDSEDEVNAEYCTCDDVDLCNGADGVRGASVAAVVLAAIAAKLVL